MVQEWDAFETHQNCIILSHYHHRIVLYPKLTLTPWVKFVSNKPTGEKIIDAEWTKFLQGQSLRRSISSHLWKKLSSIMRKSNLVIFKTKGQPPLIRETELAEVETLSAAQKGHGKCLFELFFLHSNVRGLKCRFKANNTLGLLPYIGKAEISQTPPALQ